MDIIKELQELLQDKTHIDKLMTDVAIEQESLLKKAHLLKVIGVTTLIEEATSEDFFKNSDVRDIQISLSYQYDDRTCDYEYQLTFELVDVDNRIIPISKIPSNSQNLKQFFNMAVHSLKDLRTEFYNESLHNNNIHYLGLNPGIGEKILDLLLCEELRKVYEYSRMQLDLSDNESSNKRFKI